MMEMSPYKFDHGASIKQPPWIHVAPVPDVYRGKRCLPDADLQNPQKLAEMGAHYADDVRTLLERILSQGRRVAAFLAEPLQSCGGQVVPPRNYFSAVAALLRKHGALIIMDEVQTGFGRVGHAFWAHQMQESEEQFVPDIVTMGKSMGNGFPVAAVATRREIADRHCGRAEYFNTYGGNPVACTAALAVLGVLKDDALVAHARAMDAVFARELRALQARHACIGDVRGAGMFWGLDLVWNRESRAPDPELASRVVMQLRKEHNVLLSADGPHGNILKFKPPMCFGEDDLKTVVNALDKTLTKLTMDREMNVEN